MTAWVIRRRSFQGRWLSQIQHDLCQPSAEPPRADYEIAAAKRKQSESLVFFQVRIRITYRTLRSIPSNQATWRRQSVTCFTLIEAARC